jgi:H+/Cl- antiporter ClcA
VGLLLWALIIGPIAGVAAALFVRFVGMMKVFRPGSRLPVHFEDARVGQQVRLHLVGGTRRPSFGEAAKTQRATGVVVRTTSVDLVWTSVDLVFVKPLTSPNAPEVQYDSMQWRAAEVEGPRDWKILVIMPTAFFALAISSAAFPMLLGNGRALAEVAINEDRYDSQLVTLFILKAFMTAAAIGSGADGGTLTPSVALGATLGAICIRPVAAFGSGYILWPEREIMCLVSAAAFLGAALQAPVTGLWLIIEFSAQGVDKFAFWSALHGDFKDLVESKLAVGVLLPMAIALYLSRRTFRWMNKRSRHPLRTLDLDLGDDYDDISKYKATGFSCFRAGLLLNSVITVGCAALDPRRVHRITLVSLVGFFGSTLLGFALLAHPRIAAATTGLQASLLDIESSKHIGGCEAPWRRCKRRTKVVLLLLLSTATGAAMPAVPWVLRVWAPYQIRNVVLDSHDALSGGLLALFVSVGGAILATAMAAAIGTTDETRLREVLSHVRTTALIILLVGVVGFGVSFLAERFQR